MWNRIKKMLSSNSSISFMITFLSFVLGQLSIFAAATQTKEGSIIYFICMVMMLALIYVSSKWISQIEEVLDAYRENHAMHVDTGRKMFLRSLTIGMHANDMGVPEVIHWIKDILKKEKQPELTTEECMFIHDVFQETKNKRM